jgi:hypothetical protein
MWATLTAIASTHAPHISLQNVEGFALKHIVLDLILALIILVELSYRVTRWIHWPKIQRWLLAARIVAYSIILGLLAGVIAEWAGLKDLVPFSGANDIVASVVAGTLTTGVTIYAAIWLVQIPAIEQTLKENIFDIDNFDIKNAVLKGALDQIPSFNSGDSDYPVWLCNPNADEAKRQESFDGKSAKEIALGMIVGSECEGSAVGKGYEKLIDQFEGKFSYVVLLERKGSRHALVGAMGVADFSIVVDPNRKGVDYNVTEAIGAGVKKHVVDATETQSFLAHVGFVVAKIEAGGSMRKAIAEMVRRNLDRALILQNGRMGGIAKLIRLVQIGYGYKSGQ